MSKFGLVDLPAEEMAGKAAEAIVGIMEARFERNEKRIARKMESLKKFRNRIFSVNPYHWTRTDFTRKEVIGLLDNAFPYGWRSYVFDRQKQRCHEVERLCKHSIEFGDGRVYLNESHLWAIDE